MTITSQAWLLLGVAGVGGMLLLPQPVQAANVSPAPGIPLATQGKPSGPAVLDSVGTVGGNTVTSTNGTANLSLASIRGESINVRDFGAVGATNPAITGLDGVIAAGSQSFASNAATFTAADVGKVIQIDGAAGVGQPPLVTTIAAYVGPHTVTLAAAATASVPQYYLTMANPSGAGTAGSYVPGETVAIQGGTAATAAAAKLLTTHVRKATQVANGTGGTNGACTLSGTTGSGVKFSAAATIASGAISAIGSITVSGHYITSPAAITAEPVTSNCGLTGATVSLAMDPDALSVSSGGAYSAAPSNPSATGAGSASGASGATLNLTFQRTGTYVYGVDDTAAFAAAINKTIALFAAGKQTYVFAPAGVYYINGSALPVFTGLPGGIVGDGQTKTRFIVGASYAGDLFSWSQDYLASYHPFNGPSGQITANPAGPLARGFSVMGDRLAASQQNALTFYDMNDYARLDDITVEYLNGRCFSTGTLKNSIFSFMRESRIGAVRCFNDGSAAAPVFELDAAGGGDSSNNVDLDNIDIYAPYGTGMVFRSNGSGIAGIRGSRIRVEGLESDSANIAADLMQIGDGTMVGSISDISLKQVELVDPYLGYSALHILSPTAASQPYLIDIDGNAMAGGLPLGRGIQVDTGRNLFFHLSAINTIDTGVTVGPAANGVGAIVLSGDGSEPTWTYAIDPTSVASVSVLSTKQATTGLANVTGIAGLFSVPSNDSNSLAIGSGALAAQSTGTSNIAIGRYAGQKITSGSSNVAIGYNAGGVITTASNNLAVGTVALSQSTNGSNVALGSYSLQFATAACCNVAVGSSAMQGVAAAPLTGSANTVVGVSAAPLLQAGGANNTVLGEIAAATMTTGSANVVIGQSAGGALVTGGGNILIGNGVNTPSGTDVSSKLNLGGVLVADRVSGHRGYGGTALSASALSACGTSPAVMSGSTDASGALTAGSGASACTLTFASAYPAAPSCIVTSRAGLAVSYTPAAGSLLVSATGLGGTTLDYRCINLGTGTP